MEIQFLGAAGTVTGSKYLLTFKGKRILLDCGMFQGIKKIRQRNWDELPFDPQSIDAVVLTHAHIDHTGLLPLIVKHGYKGPIYCTHATKGLCEILLPDAGYLQEEEAKYANRKRYSKHNPALPLFTQEDAERSLRLLKPVDWEQWHELGGDMAFLYRPAGHILGAASVHLKFGDKKIVFSGDIGRPDDPLMKGPEPFSDCDYLVVESTYGDRLHQGDDPKIELCEVLNRTFDRGGILIIPAFAVGRAQTILHLLSELRREGQIPRVSTYLNSPMAINATQLFCEHRFQHRISDDQCEDMFRIAEFVRSADASRALNGIQGPAVIISASGMATGGRVVHHLRNMLPDPNNTVLFAGFQAPGTRGQILQSGVEEITIHGVEVPVRAEIVDLDNLSAHADYEELLGWLSHVQKPPKGVFITHGEPVAADAFRMHLKRRFNWEADTPEYREKVQIG